MAHEAQLEFINTMSKHLPQFFNNVRVLEIGSLDIKGTIRQFYNNCEYTGIDVALGKGVDIVCQGQDYDIHDGYYDHVISCECMEHNPYWLETFLNMIRLCRPGGLITMTCAAIGRDEHGTARTDHESSPLTVSIGWNYYKNLSENHFRKKIVFDEHFDLNRFWCNWGRSDLYFAGIKKQNDFSIDTQRKWTELESYYDKINLFQNSTHRAKLREFVGTIFGDSGLRIAKKFKGQGERWPV